MSYLVKKLPNEPIILTTLYPDYEPLTEMALSVRDTLEILDNTDEPLIIVLEMQAKLDMEQIIYSANMAARGDRATWTHPKTRQVIMATNHPMASAFAEGLRSTTFRVNLVVVGSLAEAFDLIHNQTYAA